MNKKQKTVFPSKADVISNLLREDPPVKQINKIILLVEHKKISGVLGFIKGELIHNGKVILKGSMTCVPETTDDSFDWNKLVYGQSRFDGFSLDYKEDTLGSIIKQGLTNSIRDGRIPYLRK